MRAAVIKGPNTAAVVRLPHPEPGPSEVLVGVDYVGLCGTDLELLHGTSQYLTDGRSAFPHRFGHEWVGTVRAVGEQVTDLAPGAVVTGCTMLCCQSCRACASGRRNLCSALKEVGLYGWAGAAAELLVMPRPAVVSLGGGHSQPAHVLIEPLVTVLEALEVATLAPGDEVLVTGAGTIGSLAVAVLSRYPVLVDVVEPGPNIGHLPVDSYRKRFTGIDQVTGRYDVVFECSGAPGVLGAAMRLLHAGGQCLVVGVSPSPEEVDPGLLALHGIRISGVRHGVDHYARAVALFGELHDSLAALIDEVVPLAEVGRAFDRLAARRDRPKVVLGIAERSQR
ncbi:alcohol dehydrogenase catalytic domain-containing protein [Nocardia seriolae]|nr:alcohol dehydrogenase catalytic domain-containing protein [Nocardia seriolae]MTJ73029.1 alcohol dehydrogenase catalytic domain-containing protein [Nocardia seriolae]MTJ89503.1 alcohol dehydrogenase catalytic domain-containing protein [Nocardia seriolae]MTK33478.1 alcohol dehydrogenase catalytic domain-containing protein [Nocardia seriolae]MTK42618.1 alcohol dehydrogenase catalytic domain-containing protein [Nocardia seriolae]